MIPLFTEVIFNFAKGADKLPLQCEYCGKIFHHTKSRVKTLCTLNKGRFCSRECVKLSQRKPKLLVTCAQCGKNFLKMAKEVKRSSNHFCNRSCAATFNNRNKTYGTRRSKLEVWLEEQLVLNYPDLEIIFNKKTAIGSELDIYIPRLRLAFEINGIFHYEPIYGEEKLNKIQEAGQVKLEECFMKDIELVLIDTRLQKRFTEETSAFYLSEVVSKIDSILV